MSEKSKVIKYEVINTKKNKNLIGEVFDFKKVKSKGDTSDDGGKPPKSKAPSWFIEFRDEQREFNTRIEKEVLSLDSRLDRVIKVNNLKE